MSITRAKQLRREAAELWEQAKAIGDAAEKDGRTMNAEEQAKFDAIMGDGTAESRGTFDAKIAEAERLERLVDAEQRQDLETREREDRAEHDRRRGDNPAASEPVLNSPEYRDAFYVNIRGGELTPEQQQMLARGRAELPAEARAMLGSSVAAGGFALPGATLGRLIEAQKAFGSVVEWGAYAFDTTEGNDINFPMINETDVYGERLGPGQTATTGDPSSGQQKTLRGYWYSSKVIEVPIPLLVDSGFDLEGWIVDHASERIARIRNQDHTIGTGNAQPEGVVTGAYEGKVGATGNATSITKGDDLIDVQEAVDPAYRSTAAWMFNQTTLKHVRKLKSGQGVWIFEPQLQNRAPAEILGDRYVLNAEMPIMAADAKSIIYGAGRFYYVRTVTDRMFFTLRETAATRMAVQFLAFERGDGALFDAGTHPVVYWQNSST